MAGARCWLSHRSVVAGGVKAAQWRSKLCDPTADRFVRHFDPTFLEKFFNFAKAHVEMSVKPDGKGDDGWSKAPLGDEQHQLPASGWCL